MQSQAIAQELARLDHEIAELERTVGLRPVNQCSRCGCTDDETDSLMAVSEDPDVWVCQGCRTDADLDAWQAIVARRAREFHA